MIIDPLVEERFQRVWDHFKSTQKALDKADEALNQYKAMSNEFRGSLNDQSSRFSTKEEAHQVKELIEMIRLRQDRADSAYANLQGRL